MIWIKIISVLIVFFVFNVNTNDLNSDPAIIEELTSRQMDMMNILFQSKLTELKQYSLANSDSAPSVLLELTRFDVALRQSVKEIPYENFKNATLKRQIKMLRSLLIFQLDVVDGVKMLQTIEELAGAGFSPEICSYTDKTKCNLAYIPHIRSIFSDIHEPNELEYYWTEWRNVIGSKTKNKVLSYLELYKKVSQLNGFDNPVNAWYYDYDNPNFIDELRIVMDQLRPLYIQFHAYVRHVLNQRYGESVVPSTGPIPQHLLEQIELQAWKKRSLLNHPFPDKKMPNLKAELNEHGFDARKIVETASEFFTSLGLTNLPDKFWSGNVRMKSNKEAGPDCKSDITDLISEVALAYCPKAYFKRFLQMHGDMARVYYGYQKASLPIGLHYEACPGFGKAIGEAAIISASSPKHIQNIGLLKDYNYDDELSLNRLFRLGIHTIFTIPTFYVHEKLWIDMLDGKIQPDQYNCEYWKLMDQYAGVAPPIRRSNNDFDVSHKFYSGILEKSRQTEKMISEVLGYQFYRALCEKSGQFEHGNAYKPLQNCDFFNSREAGNALSDMMSKGATKPWWEIMEPVTGTKTLNAGALLEFYEPLRTFLEDENIKNNVRIGWESANKCDEF